MLGTLLSKLVGNNSKSQDHELIYKHEKIVREVKTELRVMYLLDNLEEPFLQRLVKTITWRYQKILNTLHHSSNAHVVIIRMRQLGKMMLVSGIPKHRSKQLKQYLLCFEHLTKVKDQEQKLVNLYSQTLQYLEQELITTYQAPLPYLNTPPLNTIFTAI